MQFFNEKMVEKNIELDHIQYGLPFFKNGFTFFFFFSVSAPLLSF